MKRNPDRHERSPHRRTRTIPAGLALAHVGPAAAQRSRVASMNRWQLTLAGVGAALAAMLVIWIGAEGITYSTATPAISVERGNADESYGNNTPRAMEANRQFMERARAMEAGFKAAFWFHR